MAFKTFIIFIEIISTVFLLGKKVPATEALSRISFKTAASTVDESDGFVVIIVNRTDNLNDTKFVEFNVEAGTAVNGTNYEIANNSVFFKPGQAEVGLTVRLLHDRVVSGNLTLKLTIIPSSSSSNNFTVESPKEHTVTIRNSDSTIGFKTPTATLYEEQGSFTNIELERKGSASRNQTVVIKDPVLADLTFTPSNIAFSTGETVKSFQVTITDNAYVESTRTEVISLQKLNSSDKYLEIEKDKNETTLTIEDDDVDVRLSSDEFTVTEGVGKYVVKILRRGMMSSNDLYQVNVELSDRTATSPNDYNRVSRSEVVFSANQDSKDFLINIGDNHKVDNRIKMFRIQLRKSGSKTGLRTKSPYAADILIKPDDAGFSFKHVEYESKEDAGTITIEVERTGGAVGSRTIKVLTMDGTATAGTDYTAVGRNLTFPSDGTQNFTVNITDTTVIDGTRQFTIKIITYTDKDFAVNNNVTTVKIRDNDATVKFERASYTVRENTTSLPIKVMRSGATNETHTVRLSNVSGTASFIFDYRIPATVTFGPNELEKDVIITIVNDRYFEHTETFNISLISAPNIILGNPFSAHISIVSDDADIHFCNQTIEVTEDGGPFDIWICRTKVTDIKHTISVEVTERTAKSTSDFTILTSTVLEFEPGETILSIKVNLTNDARVENNETFRVSLETTEPNSAIITGGSRDVTIYDDDTYLFCLTTNVEAKEGTTNNVTLTLKREGFLRDETVIWVTTNDGTAIAKGDYVPRYKENVTFAPGDEYASIIIMIVNDEFVENDETFNITIGAYTTRSNYRTLVVKKECSTVLIKDNDFGSPKTDKVAQEKRRNILILMGIAIGLMVLLIIGFIILTCVWIRITGF